MAKVFALFANLIKYASCWKKPVSEEKACSKQANKYFTYVFSVMILTDVHIFCFLLSLEEIFKKPLHVIAI